MRTHTESTDKCNKLCCKLNLLILARLTDGHKLSCPNRKEDDCCAGDVAHDWASVPAAQAHGHVHKDNDQLKLLLVSYFYL